MAQKRVYMNNRVYSVNEHGVRKLQALWKGFWTRKQLAGVRQAYSDIYAEIEQNDDITIHWTRKLPCKPNLQSKCLALRTVEDESISTKAESVLSEQAAPQCKTKTLGDNSHESDSEIETSKVQQTQAGDAETDGVSQSGKCSPEVPKSLNHSGEGSQDVNQSGKCPPKVQTSQNQSGEGTDADINSNGDELLPDVKHSHVSEVHIKTDASIQTDISESNKIILLPTGEACALSPHNDRHEEVGQLHVGTEPDVHKNEMTHKKEVVAPSVTESRFPEQNDQGQSGCVNESMHEHQCTEPETKTGWHDKETEPVIMTQDVPHPIGPPRQSSSPAMPVQRYDVADSYQTSVWESTQELYGGNTKGKDGTSLWDTDASVQNRVQFEHQMSENQDERRQAAVLKELNNEKDHITMELLWIQQAIESRKQYLRLKTKIAAEDQ